MTLTLALGIGATTAIFTLIRAVMLKALPVTRPEQYYGVGDSRHGGVWSGMQLDWGVFSQELYKLFRESIRSRRCVRIRDWPLMNVDSR